MASWFRRAGSRGADDTARRLQAAIAAYEAGRVDEAERCCRAILAGQPRDARALHLLGLAAHRRGAHGEAIGHIGAAIAIDPSVALFHFNLGNALAASGDRGAAAEAFARTTALDPGHFAAWFNLGRTHADTGRPAEAAEAFRRAFAIDPGSEAARHELARVLVVLGDVPPGDRRRYAEGVALLDAHWKSGPDPARSRLALAHALDGLERWSEAAGHYQGVIEAMPDAAPAHWGLGNCLNRLGRMSEAVASYRASLRLDPQDANIASALAATLIYDEGIMPQALFDEHRRWGERFAAPLEPRLRERPAGDGPARRLRIGYLSPDFRRHPVTSLFLPVLERHDAGAFETFCYHNFPLADEVTAQVRGRAAHWREVAALGDEQLAGTIAADAIDILVDLSGHTSHQRLLALARRPAPVQVSWLGYFNTTGVTAIDYFVTDPVSSPPQQDRWFVEKLIRLPHTRFCFRPTLAMPEPGALPSRERGRVVFGCCNNLGKVGPSVLALWARVLEAVPGSLLLLQASALADERNRERFLDLAQRCGIARARIELRPFVAIEHAARTYHAIDIALDPFPFCGGMTSFEALWMGVPVVTLEQELIAGRQTAAMLANLGLDDLVAATGDDYVRIAAGLAHDGERLAALRATLRRRFASSALADYDAFTRALESALRSAWIAHVEGRAPAPITLS